MAEKEYTRAELEEVAYRAAAVAGAVFMRKRPSATDLVDGVVAVLADFDRERTPRGTLACLPGWRDAEEDDSPAYAGWDPAVMRAMADSDPPARSDGGSRSGPDHG